MQFLADRNFNALIADEMGLGKTVQLLALLASRLSPEMPPALIVCPASLVANWEREAARFVPDMRTVAPVGSNRKAVIADPGSFDLLILSYNIVSRGFRKCIFQIFQVLYILHPGYILFHLLYYNV
ncbi:MAG: helicase, partial [Lentisphaeria bacterium]|nr:helicase [Lentisphaeria bacterium]